MKRKGYVTSFHPGRLLATPGVLEAVPKAELLAAFERHRHCDWGDVCDSDRIANDRALHCGQRLFSVYHALDGTKFWIITEADRAATTLLLPEEY